MRIRAKVLVLGLAAVLAFPRASGAQWVRAGGPGGCDVNALLASGDSFYAGTLDGVFRSTDNGATWQAFSSGLPALPDVECFGESGPYVFAVTDDAGVFRTARDKDSWIAVNAGLPEKPYFWCLAGCGRNLFAGLVSDGVYRLTGDGTRWEAASSGLPAAAAVQCFAEDGPYLFAGLKKGGVFRSADSGASWEAAGSGLPGDADVQSLAAHGSFLFAGLHKGGAYRSADRGDTWQVVNSGLPKDPFVDFFAASGSYLFAGAYNRVFRSADDAATWVAVSPGLPRGTRVHALAANGPVLLAGTEDFGICRSADHGQSWAMANTGLPNEAGIRRLAGTGEYMLAVSEAGTTGVFLRKNRGAGWTPISRGLPYPRTDIRDLAVIGSLVIIGSDQGVFVSEDEGRTWRSSVIAGIKTPLVECLLVNGTKLFAGFRDFDITTNSSREGVARSEDGGRSWTLSILDEMKIDTYLDFEKTLDVRCLAAKGEILLAGTRRGVFLSTDEGATWRPSSSGLPENAHVYGLEVAGASVIARVFDHGVFRTADDGKTWKVSNRGLPQDLYIDGLAVSGRNVFASVSHPARWDGKVMVKDAVDLGLFLSTNSGASWAPLGKKQQAPAEVQCFLIGEKELLAGTSDGEIWSLPLASPKLKDP
jgi:photosystem II stability/assembly factor-like uncharacterized protein